MEKEFVPYELALKMKELGFDEPCFAYYNYYIKGVPLNMYGSDYNGTGQPAPTWNSAFRWFREKYNLHSFNDCKWKNLGWEYELVDLNKMESISTIGNYGYNTPEESELECLKKLIEIVENGKTL